MITAERLLEAVTIVSAAVSASGLDKVPFPAVMQGIKVDRSKISLPMEQEIERTLTEAGAESVIAGTKNGIMYNLRLYFETRSVLKKVVSM